MTPLRVCARPGCATPVRAGYCPEHQRQQRRQYANDPRYRTERWARLSRAVRREEPLCQLCGRITEVCDHIRPADELTDAEFYDRANLRGLCQACNSARGIYRRGGRVSP